jgi:hypothetical protein
MRNKKSRKSLFNWCIRTLAVSLVPSMVLISCAGSDSKSASDTTRPKLTSISPASGSTIVGNAQVTLTFDEAVTGLTGQSSAGVCSGSIQLATSAGTCSALTVTGSSATWTVDPNGELSDGTYTLTVVATDIKDAAGNSLADNATATYTVADALSTVLNGLEADLDTAIIGSALVSSIRTAAQTAGGAVTNDLLNVIPAVFGAALDTINSSSAGDGVKNDAIDAVTGSLLENIAGTSSLVSSVSGARVAAAGGGANFTALLQAMSIVIQRSQPLPLRCSLSWELSSRILPRQEQQQQRSAPPT